ncbi:hypothetical protein F11_13275 [Rhodospirillum rubrum F11]|nr:hypothetical protein F11_13275 [Rhodospirillum rubrum F11]
MLAAQARFAAMVDKVLVSAGSAVIPAVLTASPAFPDDEGDGGARWSVRVVLLSIGGAASASASANDPLRLPGDRPALIAPGQAPPPRANDHLEVAGERYRLITAEDRSVGLGLVFRADLRPEGPEESP